jgi:hypothetical protein
MDKCWYEVPRQTESWQVDRQRNGTREESGKGCRWERVVQLGPGLWLPEAMPLVSGMFTAEQWMWRPALWVLGVGEYSSIIMLLLCATTGALAG